MVFSNGDDPLAKEIWVNHFISTYCILIAPIMIFPPHPPTHLGKREGKLATGSEY